VTQKRGQILGYDSKDGWSGWDRVATNLPQAEIHDLIVSLRSLTQGTGFFDWRYDHLNPVPERIAESVVAHHQEEQQAS
jgi:elongation factor G